MHAEQKAFLEDRFAAREWHGRSDSGRRVVKDPNSFKPVGENDRHSIHFAGSIDCIGFTGKPHGPFTFISSPSRRGSRAYVERKTLASGIFPGVHVNHLDGLWLGSRNERIVVQQQNRFDYARKLAARHRFWHRDRYGQSIRGKAAILDQDITCQLFVFLKERVNAHIDCLK